MSCRVAEPELDAAVTVEESVENPWTALPASAPFVLPSDVTAVTAFNDRRAESDCTHLRLGLLPEPFLGRPDAPIVLLRAGPGFTPDDIHFTDHDGGREVWRRNVLHQPLEYPFYPLDPALAWAEHAMWWRRKLRRVLARFDERTVANNLLSIGAVPYHAYRYRGSSPVLPSQRYSLDLVERAIDRDALILMSNTVRYWLDAVPRLHGYPHLHIARVARGGHITPGYYPEGFAHLEQVLRTCP